MSIVGNGAGIIPWARIYRKYATRDYTPKSFGLNHPLILANKTTEEIEFYWNHHPKLFKQYWNGELPRHGNNPLVCLNVESNGIKGLFNCMSFPNQGVLGTIDEIINSEGADIRASIFGNSAGELVRIINLIKPTKAHDQIKSFEINVSCPNTKPGECASSNEINQITDYIKAVRQVTNKELIVKLSPTVEVADYIEAVIKAGVDAVNISNTIPGEAYNYYTGELLMPVGGANGGLAYERMLYNVSSTYQKMKELDYFIPIYASGGIDTKDKALTAIKAGATYIDLGLAFKDVNNEGIGELINGFEEFLKAYDLESLKGKKTFGNPEWWTNPKYWHYFEDGSRKLKLYSKDHKPFKVTEVIKECVDTYTIKLNETINHQVGQYIAAMLFINGRFEERPFTLSGNDSITVKDVGIMSHALTQLTTGDNVYIRGPLGKGLKTSDLGKTLIIGGGCGTAAIAEIPEKVNDCYTILAFSKWANCMFEKRLSNYCDVNIHVDEDAGCFLPLEEINYFNEYKDIVLCGPNEMMFNAALNAVKQDVSADHIFLINESIFKCFNGLCGACDCGGIRFCRDGPVTSLSELIKQVDEFLIRDHSGSIVDNIIYPVYQELKRLVK